jgi:hypothetical protein
MEEGKLNLRRSEMSQELHGKEQAQPKPPHPDDHGRDEVTITINNDAKTIHRGRNTVAEIKTLGGIPQADVLEQNIAGTLTPLDDNGAVTIKGGEIFMSHPRDGGSS